MDIPTLLKVFPDPTETIAVLGGLVAFIVGLYQYRKAQRWKSAEWIAQEMKGLFADPLVQATLLMIDWDERDIHLALPQPVRVTDAIARGALKHHSTRPPFDPTEAAIRDAFDRFLDGLERVESYVVTGLVTDAGLDPYLSYWAHRIESTSGRHVQMWQYMKDYHFDGAARLLGRLAARAKTRSQKA